MKIQVVMMIYLDDIFINRRLEVNTNFTEIEHTVETVTE